MQNALCTALAILLLPASDGTRDGPAASGTAQRTLEILARSCAPCHNERMRRPKGNFGFVLDLDRLTRAGEYIVRGKPAASGLMRVIEDGSMPPPKSEFPALSAAERAALQDWILEGAPTGPVDRSALPAPAEIAEVSAAGHYIGQCHRLFIHFPIGLLIAAAGAEAVYLFTKQTQLRAAGSFCLLAGTAGACAASLTGWFLAADLGYAIGTHRWLGIATSLFSLAACRLAAHMRRPAASRGSALAYHAVLAGTIVLLVISSHLGATAT